MFKDILNKKLEANDLSVYQVAKETNIPNPHCMNGLRVSGNLFLGTLFRWPIIWVVP